MSVNSRLLDHRSKESILYVENSESNCARKETVDTGLLLTSKNGNRKIMQSIWKTSRHTMRIGRWNQFSQFR